MDNFNFKNLQLAYGAVYDQNLCESMEELGLIGNGNSEQDQFELWVNELLDEGHDLSDYTWDELYEGYKKLPVGKMIKQAARKGENLIWEPDDKLAKQVSKMARVASRHSQIKGKGRVRGEGQAELNRRKGEMKEDFELWVNELLDEGHDLSDYTWDELGELYEELTGPRAERLDAKGRKESLKTPKSKARGVAAVRLMAGKQGSRDSQGKVKNLPTKRSQNPRWYEDSYNYDAFDVVLEYLLDEGFADTLKSAEAIMVNMSEEWIEGILVEKEGYGDAAIDKDPLSKYRPDSEALEYLKKNPYNVNRRFFPKSGELSRGSRNSSDVMDTLKKMEGKSKPTRKLPDPDRSNRAPKPRVLPNPKR